MHYDRMLEATFLSRPNRFVAMVELNGQQVVCHVKNTGRCKELLIPGATVYLQKAASPERKTAYDLIAVRKGQRLINMDAAAPNQVFGEWARAGHLLPQPTLVKAEAKRGASRLDFYIENADRKAWVEVKGVTLEEDGYVRFPDAPTERGVKHLGELEACVRDGYEAYAVFVIQMEGVKDFAPNWQTHPAFGEALCHAAQNGVQVLALDCHVEVDEMHIQQAVPVVLEKP
ncbi:MAG: DNA/RNA nuclease SfsA [Clostridia bacterium]|nr:DNA/RNA nuclease SfsA [Clostridia bacterium]